MESCPFIRGVQLGEVFIWGSFPLGCMGGKVSA